jgi:hypothetical protein
MDVVGEYLYRHYLWVVALEDEVEQDLVRYYQVEVRGGVAEIVLRSVLAMVEDTFHMADVVRQLDGVEGHLDLPDKKDTRDRQDAWASPKLTALFGCSHSTCFE